MLGRLLILFVCVPLVELGLLIVISQQTDLLFTISLVLVTGLLGASLSRSQGVRAWRSVQTEMAAGRMPSNALFDALMILVAGALLITPGILTDIVGFSLLTPPIRRILQRRIMKRLGASLSMTGSSATWNVSSSGWDASSAPDWEGENRPIANKDDDVIDVEFRSHDE